MTFTMSSVVILPCPAHTQREKEIYVQLCLWIITGMLLASLSTLSMMKKVVLWSQLTLCCFVFRYRARVEGVASPKEIHVFYIDYGNVSICGKVTDVCVAWSIEACYPYRPDYSSQTEIFTTFFYYISSSFSKSGRINKRIQTLSAGPSVVHPHILI